LIDWSIWGNAAPLRVVSHRLAYTGGLAFGIFTSAAGSLAQQSPAGAGYAAARAGCATCPEEDGSAKIQTTLLLAVAQFRPRADHGLFQRAGMGVGIAGNGLYNPAGPPLAPPYTTNALGIAYGIGWEFLASRRWGVQVHAMQHVAALGELTTTAGTSVKNVVGNYWTVGAGVVIR
jgi:hypothetical protein